MREGKNTYAHVVCADNEGPQLERDVSHKVIKQSMHRITRIAQDLIHCADHGGVREGVDLRKRMRKRSTYMVPPAFGQFCRKLNHLGPVEDPVDPARQMQAVRTEQAGDGDRRRLCLARRPDWVAVMEARARASSRPQP